MSQEMISPDEGFEQKLMRLRTRIDLLPAEQRPHLHKLADAVSREQLHLKERTRSTHDSH